MDPAFEIPFGIRPTNAVPVDAYSGPKEGYIDVAAACAAVPFVVRYYGQEVRIQSANGIVKYSWVSDLSDAGLVPLASGTGTGGTPYTLPVATETTLGGVKVGQGLSIDSTTGVLSADAAQGATVDITPNVTLNGLKAGTRYQISLQEFATLATTIYYAPSFGSFTFNGTSSTTVPVGTSYATGSRRFAWNTNNSQSISPAGLTIRDVTGNQNLATGLPATGFTDVSTPGFSVVQGLSRRYLISGNDTQGNVFTAEMTVSGAYEIFYGSVANTPTTSAQVRALPESRLTTQGNQFIINTGSVNRRFAFWVPQGLSLQSVFDLDSANANLTSQYAASPLSVNDAGGSPVAGTLYVMEQAVPYTSNHRHAITVG
ncbi:hypothetical protein [Hymenobacter glacieicola]|uniref:Uncharacterized protein n=1 Tax=Hymenobacter glacieicola TaxID=1562124 RepID=A0ABQ1WLU3_9BACT|nr:hypothetical protein [Hymenobacter glacieicola]GGG34262.1 hypothetical protein GCM10011378_08340 [Hymenobacter glacieicola]